MTVFAIDICNMTLDKNTKEALMKESQRHDSDTGSPEVQVSLLTKKIQKLSDHLKTNRQDKHGRRGLLGMVERRRRHLKYLLKKDPARHDEIVKKIKE